MGRDIHKLNTVKSDSIDKSNVFVEVTSVHWKTPSKISVEDLLKDVKKEDSHEKKYDIEKDIDNKTIILDPHTLKIKVNDSFKNLSNVCHESLKKDKVDIYRPPKNASELSGLHLMTDSNYLYIWVGNRWKRVLLSEW